MEVVDFTVVEAVDFTAVEAVGFTRVVVDLAAFTAGAVAFMDLPPMVARPTSVMG